MESSVIAEYTRDKEYMECVEDILDSSVFQSLDCFIHHGTTTCRDHSIQVSYLGYKLCKRFGGNWRSAARAGLLHDLFLYDWHTHARETGNYFHGFTHPGTALTHARTYFVLSWEEEDAILRHMWPLTLTPPATRVGFSVNCADKICSIVETTACIKSRILMRFLARPVRR